tara:strand:- start:10357 stop:11214 length:858 start_codon:yes stop_codon:yes gene_type:complete
MGSDSVMVTTDKIQYLLNREGNFEMGRLNNKVAVITGAAGGIGAAAAEIFVREGAKVVVSDLAGEQLAELAHRLGDNAIAFPCNVTDKAEVEALMDKAIEQFGGLDAVVLNAGLFGELTGLLDYTDDAYERVINVNQKGVWYGLRAAARRMLERTGGSIVITSSTQGFSGYYNSAPYTASKHAVMGIMRNAAIEFAKKGVRVNTVHPGLTDTSMMGGLHSEASPDNPAAVMEGFAVAAPMGRYARPEEIANMMLFLASDEASYCTGGTYAVDGGLLAYHGGPHPE